MFLLAAHLLMLEYEITISTVISLRFKTHLALWLPRVTGWTCDKTGYPIAESSGYSLEERG